MKNWFYFLLSTIIIISCHQQKRVATTATIIKDTATAMNTQPDKYRKQLEEGIDFIASGTEPFWSLEIDFDKTMHFKTVSGPDISTPAVRGVKAMDANVTRYAAETEQGGLIIQIRKQECINNMSGKKSDYQVTIDAKDNKEQASERYEGCGQYLYDYRLNDIWVLESVNHQKLNGTDFTKGLPQLELNMAQQKIFGHTGCNNITGPMEVQGKKIRFGYLADTKMACPDTGFENSYLNSLSNHTMPYFIEPGKLHLQVSPHTTYTYRKID